MLTAAHARSIDEPEVAVNRLPPFRLLGNLEVWLDDRPVEIRGTIQRTLMATLLAAGSRTVSVQELVDELWGENPPITASNSLQAHVSRLRRKLHRSGDLHSALSSPPAGYRLLVDPSYVDGLIFRQTLIDIRHATASIDPAVAVARLRAVLAMWRGPVFGGLTGGPICQAASSRFLADREVAVETLYDFELRLGRHCEVIPELSGLLESASLNERTCEQLMVALYRAGRQSDALDTFRRMRSRLDDDLGVEPSPALRRIENAILNHHPALRVGADHGTLRV